MTVTLKPKPAPVKPIVKPVVAAATTLQEAPVPEQVPTPAPAPAKPPKATKKAATAPAPVAAETEQESSAVNGTVDPDTGEITQPMVIEKGDIKAQITKTYKDGSSTTEEEVVASDVNIPTPHASVGLSMGLTKNMGDYENLKVQVSLWLPCAPDAEEIEGTYIAAKEWVDEKIQALNDEIEAMKG